jgi:GT2 family glycosyltransferase
MDSNEMKKPDILIIGVNYNTYPETLRYLDSIADAVNQNVSVILVDNSNEPKPVGFEARLKAFPFLIYIETGKNLGYFHGANVGLKHFLQEYKAYPKWVLVTNVDIVFKSNFFQQLEKLNDNADLGVVAPSIISKKWDTDYNPKVLERYSKRKLLFYRALYSNFLLHNIFLTGAYLKKWISGSRSGTSGETPHDSKVVKIYAPHGSCVVLKDTYFTRGGTLDLPNFLFGEEIYVAESAARAGLDVEYHPEMVIYDYEHASVGFFVTPAINRYYKESIQLILKMYYQQEE